MAGPDPAGRGAGRSSVSPRVSGVGSDQLRRHNLSAILTLLHHGGSQPRSTLTAQTGLNRSTVAALVAELCERGLAYETEPDPTRQVGRPSPTVNPDERNVAIAINPEVDAITIGVVALGGRVVRSASATRPTTRRPRARPSTSAPTVIEGFDRRARWSAAASPGSASRCPAWSAPTTAS